MTFGAGHLVGQFAAIQDGASIGGGSFVDLGDGTSLEVFYNNGAGNIQIERVNNASLAASYKWTDATGNWNTAANWSGGQVPNPTANVVIGNTATGNVTLNGLSGDQTVNSLSILASNALTVSGVSLTSRDRHFGGGGRNAVAGQRRDQRLGAERRRADPERQRQLGSRGDTISANTTFIGQDNTSTELLGAINNAGTIEQIGGNGANGILTIGNSVTLTGGGTVLLDSNVTSGGSAYLQGVTSNQILTNTDNTILGTGVIGNGNLVVINGGLIEATPTGGTSTLTLNGGGITNTGTMEATAGALLVITPIVDNAGGTIITADATSTVELLNAQVQGGTLQNAAGGTLETVGNAALDGATQGALTISAGSFITATDNSTTTLKGTINNLGTIEQIGGNGANGVLAIGGAVTLTGGGTVLLDTNLTSGGAAFILGNGGTLTNTNNTILGTGVIGNGSLTLVNGGVIDATPEGGTSALTLNGSGGVTNTKLLEATAGGALLILTNVINKGGTITATGSLSAVTISNGATITGGTLNAVSGGVMGSTGSATLSSVTLSSGSLFTAGNNSTTTLLGTITNLGTIKQIGGNGANGLLVISGAVTLAGGGKVLLDTIATSGGNAFIMGNGGTLTNTSQHDPGYRSYRQRQPYLDQRWRDQCNAGGWHLEPDAERVRWCQEHQVAGSYSRRCLVDRHQCNEHRREHHRDWQPECGDCHRRCGHYRRHVEYHQRRRHAFVGQRHSARCHDIGEKSLYVEQWQPPRRFWVRSTTWVRSRRSAGMDRTHSCRLVMRSRSSAVELFCWTPLPPAAATRSSWVTAIP